MKCVFAVLGLIAFGRASQVDLKKLEKAEAKLKVRRAPYQSITFLLMSACTTTGQDRETRETRLVRRLQARGYGQETGALLCLLRIVTPN